MILQLNFFNQIFISVFLLGCFFIQRRLKLKSHSDIGQQNVENQLVGRKPAVQPFRHPQLTYVKDKIISP